MADGAGMATEGPALGSAFGLAGAPPPSLTPTQTSAREAILRGDRPEHVTAVLEKLLTGSWDAVWTVSPTDLKYHPLKQLTVGEDGAMEYFDPRGSSVIARQQLGLVYHRNGAAYAVTRDCLLRQETLKGTRTAAVIVAEPMVSIDSLDDFARVELLLRSV